MAYTGPKWDERRKLRFVRDWNDDLDSGAIQEVYGIRHPYAIAAWLRREGHVLTVRHRVGARSRAQLRPGSGI